MPFFTAAAVLTVLIAALHIIVGGRQIARPLSASNTLEPVVRDTQHLCWHLTSAALLLMAAFLAATPLTGNVAYAIAGTSLAASFALVGVGLAPLIGQSYRVLPQGWLFVPVTLLGIAGLVL